MKLTIVFYVRVVLAIMFCIMTYLAMFKVYSWEGIAALSMPTIAFIALFVLAGTMQRQSLNDKAKKDQIRKLYANTTPRK